MKTDDEEDRMWRAFAALSLTLAAGGCMKEPAAPTAGSNPVPVIVSEDSTAPPDSTASPADMPSAVGKWTHTLPGGSGTHHTVVLEYLKDQDGHERFEFLEWPWTEKPVFDAQVLNGEETRLKFVLQSPDSNDPPRTLEYVLRRENGQWIGTLFESWSNAPLDVRLTKVE
jgi:hypothetical protein